MPGTDTFDLLRLTLTPGLGPVLITRCIEAYGSAGAALRASARDLQRVRGIGQQRAHTIRRGMDESEALAREESELAQRLQVALVAFDDSRYPPLLRQISDAPPLLYAKGELDAAHDRHCVGIVGSRNCTHYGVEQAERFGAMLAQAGLTIASGGARGIDTAAHRAALRVNARTVVVMGCGLASVYPPENAELFQRIVETPGAGALISELPLRTLPAAENFPARNRIISGMSLGVLVIEASNDSGALITARAAAEDHGREVMAVPGRIDSPASAGSNLLIKKGEAALVTAPADVIEILEQPARHLHHGVHEARYARPAPEPEPAPGGLPFAEAKRAAGAEATSSLLEASLTPTQKAIVAALSQPKSVDELVRETGLATGELVAAATVLEIRRVVTRQGNRLARRQA